MFCVYGLFKPSMALELGINKLKEKGYTGDRMTVVVLDAKHPGRQTLLDSMYSSDRMSLLDGMAVTSSIGMLLGVIYGSEVYIGPIALGLIGAISGGAFGYLLDRMVNKKRQAGAPPSGEVIVAVRCLSEDDAVQAESIMKEYRAAALGRGPVI